MYKICSNYPKGSVSGHPAQLRVTTEKKAN